MKKITKKTIIYSLIVSFIFSYHIGPAVWVAHATPGERDSSPQAFFPKDLNQVQIPAEMGKIEEVYSVPSTESRVPSENIKDQNVSPSTRDSLLATRYSPVVILIQDAHSIPEAQRSIRGIIDHFQNKYGVKLVGVEGAYSQLDAQIFKSFPDKKLLKETLEAYFDQGEITGSTASAILSDKEGIYHGVEDWDLYEQGIALYLAAMGKEPEILEELSKTEKKQEAEKQKIYSKELLEVDQAITSFWDNKTDLIKVLKTLAKVKRPEKGSELEMLLTEGESDGKDQSTVEMEVKKIAGEVEKYLKQHALSHEQRAFNEKNQEFQTSRISPQAFALWMKELTDSLNRRGAIHRNRDGSDFRRQKMRTVPDFSDRLMKLIHTQKRMRDIQGTKFFEEFEHYADSVKEGLFKDEKQRKLDQESRRLNLMKRLAHLELSREDWKEVKASPWTMDDGRWTFHLAFYENAEKRDEAFFNRLTGLMKENKTDQALMVSGGFHTEGLVQRLKEKKISYILLMPKINAIPEDWHYKEQMRGEVSWKDYFEVENGKINLYKAFVRAVRDRLLEEGDRSKVLGGRDGEASQYLKPDTRHLLKNWRDQIIRDLAEKGEIEKAGEYTLFMDEVTQKESKDELAKRLERVNQFIEGLKDLETKGKLTEQNILKLLQPSGATVQPVVDGPATLSGDLVNTKIRIPGIEGEFKVIELPSGLLVAQPRPLAARRLAIGGRAEVRAGGLFLPRALYPDKLAVSTRTGKQELTTRLFGISDAYFPEEGMVLLNQRVAPRGDPNEGKKYLHWVTEDEIKKWDQKDEANKPFRLRLKVPVEYLGEDEQGRDKFNFEEREVAIINNAFPLIEGAQPPKTTDQIVAEVEGLEANTIRISSAALGSVKRVNAKGEKEYLLGLNIKKVAESLKQKAKLLGRGETEQAGKVKIEYQLKALGGGIAVKKLGLAKLKEFGVDPNAYEAPQARYEGIATAVEKELKKAKEKAQKENRALTPEEEQAAIERGRSVGEWDLRIQDFVKQKIREFYNWISRQFVTGELIETSPLREFEEELGTIKRVNEKGEVKLEVGEYGVFNLEESQRLFRGGIPFDFYEEAIGYRYLGYLTVLSDDFAKLPKDEQARIKNAELQKIKGDFAQNPELVLKWQVYEDFKQAFVAANQGNEELGKLLDEATVIASEYHAKADNSIRDDARAYIAHPLEIAYQVVREGKTDKRAVIAALFHDLIEDTEAKEETGRIYQELISKVPAGLLTQADYEVVLGIVGKLTENTSYREAADLLAKVNKAATPAEKIKLLTKQGVTNVDQIDAAVAQLNQEQIYPGTPYIGRLATKMEHIDRVSTPTDNPFVDEIASVIKVIDRGNNIKTNISNENFKQRRMDLEEIERWRTFLARAPISADLRNEITALLEWERIQPRGGRAEVRQAQLPPGFGANGVFKIGGKRDDPADPTNKIRVIEDVVIPISKLGRFRMGNLALRVRPMSDQEREEAKAAKPAEEAPSGLALAEILPFFLEVYDGETFRPIRSVHFLSGESVYMGNRRLPNFRIPRVDGIEAEDPLGRRPLDLDPVSAEKARTVLYTKDAGQYGNPDLNGIFLPADLYDKYLSRVMDNPDENTTVLDNREETPDYVDPTAYERPGHAQLEIVDSPEGPALKITDRGSTNGTIFEYTPALQSELPANSQMMPSQAEAGRQDAERELHSFSMIVNENFSVNTNAPFVFRPKLPFEIRVTDENGRTRFLITLEYRRGEGFFIYDPFQAANEREPFDPNVQEVQGQKVPFQLEIKKIQGRTTVIVSKRDIDLGYTAKIKVRTLGRESISRSEVRAFNDQHLSVLVEAAKEIRRILRNFKLSGKAKDASNDLKYLLQSAADTDLKEEMLKSIIQRSNFYQYRELLQGLAITLGVRGRMQGVDLETERQTLERNVEIFYANLDEMIGVNAPTVEQVLKTIDETVQAKKGTIEILTWRWRRTMVRVKPRDSYEMWITFYAEHQMLEVYIGELTAAIDRKDPTRGVEFDEPAQTLLIIDKLLSDTAKVKIRSHEENEVTRNPIPVLEHFREVYSRAEMRALDATEQKLVLLGIRSILKGLPGDHESLLWISSYPESGNTALEGLSQFYEQEIQAIGPQTVNQNRSYRRIHRLILDVAQKGDLVTATKALQVVKIMRKVAEEFEKRYLGEEIGDWSLDAMKLEGQLTSIYRQKQRLSGVRQRTAERMEAQRPKPEPKPAIPSSYQKGIVAMDLKSREVLMTTNRLEDFVQKVLPDKLRDSVPKIRGIGLPKSEYEVRTETAYPRLQWIRTAPALEDFINKVRTALLNILARESKQKNVASFYTLELIRYRSSTDRVDQEWPLMALIVPHFRGPDGKEVIPSGPAAAGAGGAAQYVIPTEPTEWFETDESGQTYRVYEDGPIERRELWGRSEVRTLPSLIENPMEARSRRGDKKVALTPASLGELQNMLALARKNNVELQAALYMNKGVVVGVDYPKDETKFVVIKSKSKDEFQVTEETNYFGAPAFTLARLKKILAEMDEAKQEGREGDMPKLEAMAQKTLAHLNKVMIKFESNIEIYSTTRNERYQLVSDSLVNLKQLSDISSILKDIGNAQYAVTSWFGSIPLQTIETKPPEHDETISIHNHPNTNPTPPSAISKERGLGDIYMPSFFDGEVNGIILDTPQGDRLFLFHEPSYEQARESEYEQAYKLYWYKNGDPASGPAAEWNPENQTYGPSENWPQVLALLENLSMETPTEPIMLNTKLIIPRAEVRLEGEAHYLRVAVHFISLILESRSFQKNPYMTVKELYRILSEPREKPQTEVEMEYQKLLNKLTPPVLAEWLVGAPYEVAPVSYNDNELRENLRNAEGLITAVAENDETRMANYREQMPGFFYRTLNLIRRADLRQAQVGPEGTRRAEVRAVNEAETYQKLEVLFADPNRSLDQIQSELQALLPTANIELNQRYIYGNRKEIPSPDRFFGMLYDYLKGHPELKDVPYLRVLDFNTAQEELGQRNIVRNAVPENIRGKLYHDLLARPPTALSAEEQSALLTEEERAALFSGLETLLDEGRLFHIDHHYDFPVLATTSTTVLLTDFLLYLHNRGRTDLTQKIQEQSFGIMDHSDADILLAHFVATNANRPEFLRSNRDLLADTVLLNDYIIERGDTRHKAQVSIFYGILRNLEDKIAAGQLKYSDAFNQVESALNFARNYGETYPVAELFNQISNPASDVFKALVADQVSLAQDFLTGAADYIQDQVVIREMMETFDPVKTDVVPGTVRKVGPVLFFYVADNQKEVGNSSVLRNLLSESPNLLEGVFAIVTSSPDEKSTASPKSRFVKIRTFMMKDGQFLNLSKTFWKDLEGLGKYGKPGGRGMAGGLGKESIPNLNVAVASQDVANAIAAQVRAQFPSRADGSTGSPSVLSGSRRAEVRVFKIGEVNTNEDIDQLTELTGVPITEIERRARPRSYASSGFINDTESFKDVLKEDNTLVRSRGLTHQQLAEPLLLAVRQGKGEFVFNGQTFQVTSVAFRGVQQSIFQDNLGTNRDYTVTNLATGQSINFSGLIPEYINRYGFYEGHVAYRLEPQRIIELFGLAVQGQIPSVPPLAPERTQVRDMVRAFIDEQAKTGRPSFMVSGPETVTLNGVTDPNAINLHFSNPAIRNPADGSPMNYGITFVRGLKYIPQALGRGPAAIIEAESSRTKKLERFIIYADGRAEELTDALFAQLTAQPTAPTAPPIAPKPVTPEVQQALPRMNPVNNPDLAQKAAGILYMAGFNIGNDKKHSLFERLRGMRLRDGGTTNISLRTSKVSQETSEIVFVPTSFDSGWRGKIRINAQILRGIDVTNKIVTIAVDGNLIGINESGVITPFGAAPALPQAAAQSAPSAVALMSYDALLDRIREFPPESNKRPGLGFVLDDANRTAGVLTIRFLDSGASLDVSNLGDFTVFRGDIFIKHFNSGKNFATEYARIKRSGEAAELQEDELPLQVARAFGIARAEVREAAVDTRSREVAQGVARIILSSENLTQEALDTLIQTVRQTVTEISAARFGEIVREEAQKVLEEIAEKERPAVGGLAVTKEMAENAITWFTNFLVTNKIEGNLAVAFDDPEGGENLLEALEKPGVQSRIGLALFKKGTANGKIREGLKGLNLQFVSNFKSMRPSKAVENSEAVPVVGEDLKRTDYLGINGALFGVGVNKEGAKTGEPFLGVVEKVLQITSGLLLADRIKKVSDLNNPEIKAALLKDLFDNQEKYENVIEFGANGITVNRSRLMSFVTEYLAKRTVESAA